MCIKMFFNLIFKNENNKKPAESSLQADFHDRIFQSNK
ncbi:hypothetical protein B425_2765 [Bacillus amyloliquefaciens]|nr:hypothetical protein B425_2765 [Bacillus amyloliquefaciens]